MLRVSTINTNKTASLRGQFENRAHDFLTTPIRDLLSGRFNWKIVSRALQELYPTPAPDAGPDVHYSICSSAWGHGRVADTCHTCRCDATWDTTALSLTHLRSGNTVLYPIYKSRRVRSKFEWVQAARGLFHHHRVRSEFQQFLNRTRERCSTYGFGRFAGRFIVLKVSRRKR